MWDYTITDPDSEVSPPINTLLQNQRLRAVVTDPPGCDTVMLVDYVFIVDEKVLLVLIEQHGHRARLFEQDKPGEWLFRPVFKYQSGKPLHNTFGPRVVQINCKELEKLLT